MQGTLTGGFIPWAYHQALRAGEVLGDGHHRGLHALAGQDARLDLAQVDLEATQVGLRSGIGFRVCTWDSGLPVLHARIAQGHQRVIRAPGSPSKMLVRRKPRASYALLVFAKNQERLVLGCVKWPCATWPLHLFKE